MYCVFILDCFKQWHQLMLYGINDCCELKSKPILETKTKNPILYSFLRLRLSTNAGKTDTGKIIFPDPVKHGIEMSENL